MKTIGILTNMQKDKDLHITRTLLKVLEDKNVDIRLDLELACILHHEDLGVSEPQFLEEIEILIVLGGDGTILNAARKVASLGIPILGINLGHLGFLSEIEVHTISEGIDKLIKEEYTIEERMMLSAVVIRNGQTEEMLHALNDVGIARSSLSRMIRIEVYINDHCVDQYPADGIVVSSPTGSTAYSLSAGGPIISPAMHCLLLTPICAHTLHSRPIIIGENEIVRLRVVDQHHDALLTLDGQQGYKLGDGDWVVIQKASRNARFVRLEEKNFYTLLRRKLSEWSQCTNDEE